ncbi:MAG: helix-turn-helix domain-containing protein [Gemmatimonadales bacterium]|nr:helix-turn-helix domain-containing protein [Gemmatimonadales bacterium]
MRTPPPAEADLPDGLPPWLPEFIREAQRETEILRDNGAHQAATARAALIHKLLAAATTWLDSEIDVSEAARAMEVCEETIRRAVRHGDLPDRRPHPKGRHRIRRGDLEKLAATHPKPYDAHADAQDIARRRRQFP